jgi:hypothetical protein
LALATERHPPADWGAVRVALRLAMLASLAWGWRPVTTTGRKSQFGSLLPPVMPEWSIFTNAVRTLYWLAWHAEVRLREIATTRCNHRAQRAYGIVADSADVR